MHDIANINPKILYNEFGINAELLIDHAWGRESCTIADIKKYKPKTNSISTNQVLFEDYDWNKARLVLKEMVELKSIELVEKGLVTDTINLYIGYSKNVISPSGGTYKISLKTNTYTELLKGFLTLYDKTTNMFTPIRRIGISFEKVEKEEYIQLDFFIDRKKIEKERKVEGAISQIRREMGPNTILKGMNYEEGATTRLRNTLIGGHNAI